jgi:ABC-type oligopeptide transport system substrate-binding subunit
VINKSLYALSLVVVLLMSALTGCGPAPTTVSPPPLAIATDQPALQPTLPPPPTSTPEPTLTLKPTPLPGKVVIPLESLQYGLPWMPMDPSQIPMVVYYGFNVNQPPFNVPEVRLAFAAALDTRVLTLIYEKGPFYNNEVATRNVLPPSVLSRDVSGEIGIPFDPQKAKQYLATAGYADPSSFPPVNLLVIYMVNAPYPGLLVSSATEAIRMWKVNLGVTVTLEVKVITNFTTDQRDLINSGKYDIFEHGVWAGSNDPDSFMSSMFLPRASNNLTGFENARVTILIQDGQKEVDPAKRLPIYMDLERILSEELMPIIPIFHCTVNLGG